MILIDKAKAKEIDKSDMYEILKSFPLQAEQAIEIGKSAPVAKADGIKNVLILGMGGSAIGGDLLRTYSAATDGAEHIHFAVNRNYDIPKYTDSETLVIASSYSGGTEETLNGFYQANKITKNLLAITSGGELEKFADDNSIPVIKIPGGMMPRCALGLSFFPLLIQMTRSGIYKSNSIEKSNVAIQETLEMLKIKSNVYDKFDDNNPAYSLAKQLFGKIPVIYSAQERLDTVNLRWRGQILENAKNLCFGNLLPEMNHNEINGWSEPHDITKRFVVIMLEDDEDHKRNKIRMKAVANVLGNQAGDIIKLKGEGQSLLCRMFDLIYLADWTSYFLALFNNTDPTPIPLISLLKSELAKAEN